MGLRCLNMKAILKTKEGVVLSVGKWKTSMLCQLTTTIKQTSLEECFAIGAIRVWDNFLITPKHLGKLPTTLTDLYNHGI